MSAHPVNVEEKATNTLLITPDLILQCEVWTVHCLVTAEDTPLVINKGTQNKAD